MKAYWIWTSASLFYIYQFILRISPSLMLDDLMQVYGMTATEVSQLSALAVYAYALMQTPAGVLVDLYGVKKILLISILLCLLGITLFSMTQKLWIAQAGRIFLGLGSASAFLSLTKISMIWFPVEKRGLLLGASMAMGTIGASLGSWVLATSIETVGWRQSLLWTNLFGILTLILCFVFIPSSLQEKHLLKKNFFTNYSKIIKNLIALLYQPSFWIFSCTALGIYLVICVLADLWGISFIMQHLNLTKTRATKIISLIYVGLCLGSLSLSFLSGRFQIRHIILRISLLALLIFLGLLIYSTWISEFLASIYCFFIGFWVGSEMLCFANLCDTVSEEIVGTATGLMNCIVMFGGAIASEQIGKLLDFYWQGVFYPQSSQRFYQIYEYQKAFTLLMIVLFFISILSYLTPSQQTGIKTHQNGLRA